ncbi:MAG: hypothetical protein HKO57_04085, partial [Akkermansiaceae bacterium]|nr:hypothetical protein [Akkermansiaceae bacterium]
VPTEGKGTSGPAVSRVWKQLSGRIEERLAEITLEAIANDAAAPMYHI